MTVRSPACSHSGKKSPLKIEGFGGKLDGGTYAQKTQSALFAFVIGRSF